MEPVVRGQDPELDALRRIRAELRGAMSALELALAAPTPGRHAAWVQRVEEAMAEVAADFAAHIAETEGPTGAHEAVLVTAPRLAHPVRRLVSDHAVISGCIDDLRARLSSPVAADDAGAVRDLGTALLGRLARHRQQGADLIYEAYQVDLGGET